MGLNFKKMVSCLFDIVLVSTIVLSSISSTLLLTDDNLIKTSSKFENNDKEFTINIARRHCTDFAVRNNIVFTSIGGDLRYFYLDNLTELRSYFTLDGVNFRNPNYFAQNNEKLFVNADMWSNNTIFQLNIENETIHIEKSLVIVNFTIIKMSLTEKHLLLFGYNWYYHPHLMVYEMLNGNDMKLIANSTINHSMKEVAVDEKRVFVLTEEGNLALYEIRDNHKIEFIFEYLLNNIKFAFSDNCYVYICDNYGLKIFEIFENTRIKSVSSYRIENAKNVYVKDNIIYLITSRKLLILDQSEITDIKLLDEHKMNNRINLEYKKILVYNNSCIILNEFYESQHEITTYTGPIFIFDVTNPEKIIRIYPDKIPFGFGLGMIPVILMGGIICSIFSCIGIVGIILKVKKKE